MLVTTRLQRSKIIGPLIDRMMLQFAGCWINPTLKGWSLSVWKLLKDELYCRSFAVSVVAYLHVHCSHWADFWPVSLCINPNPELDGLGSLLCLVEGVTAVADFSFCLKYSLLSSLLFSCSCFSFYYIWSPVISYSSNVSNLSKCWFNFKDCQFTLNSAKCMKRTPKSFC